MSNRQRTYRTHAVVLRRRDYLDADRILMLFTPNMGKVEAIAKGIRKTMSRKAGHLELLTHTTLLLAQGRTWDIVSEAVTVESFRHLRLDLDCISAASYISELIDSFSESDDENRPLWDLLLLALRQLDEYGHQPEHQNIKLLLRWFELHLLSVTGFQPQLFHCVGCGNEIEPVLNYLNIAAGGIFCLKCHAYNSQGQRSEFESIEPDVLKVLRFLQSRSWSEVQSLQVRLEIMQRVENILYRYLIVVLERQLKSATFLRRILG